MVPPKWNSGKVSACQFRGHKRHGFHLRVKKIPCSRKWQPTQVHLPGKFQAQRNLVDYIPRAHKELNTTECLSAKTKVYYNAYTANLIQDKPKE